MKYTLKETEGHSHTAELDEKGNGESSTEMDHKHKIEGKTCMEAGSPAHIHTLEEVKVDEKDQEASVHTAFLKEKVDAIAGIANNIAKNGVTMTPEVLRDQISAMQDISWKITELIGVIRAKDIKIDSALVDSALKAIGDTKGIEGTLNDIRSRHEVLVDEVMDFSPPNARKHYEAKDNRELEEIIKLLDSQSLITLPANDSSSASKQPDETGSKGRKLTDALQKRANAALGK